MKNLPLVTVAAVSARRSVAPSRNAMSVNTHAVVPTTQRLSAFPAFVVCAGVHGAHQRPSRLFVQEPFPDWTDGTTIEPSRIAGFAGSVRCRCLDLQTSPQS